MCPFLFLLQTELLGHCSDVPPLARVVQEDGKMLLQAVLEVRSSHLAHQHKLFCTASSCLCSVKPGNSKVDAGDVIDQVSTCASFRSKAQQIKRFQNKYLDHRLA